MLDARALIEIGHGLGGIAIGTSVATLLAAAEPIRVVELPGDGDEPGVTIHSFGAIRTWSVKGTVMQVGAFDGHRGQTPASIGIGSTVDVPDSAARVIQIFVHGIDD